LCSLGYCIIRIYYSTIEELLLMKKILENIEKNELLEYYRSSSGKFAVGNFVGINNDFAIFTSISPFGRFEGYRFIKIED